MRIAFIANPYAPGGWYRGVGPMVALAARGHEIVQVWRPETGIRGELAVDCEVVHVYRAHGEDVQRIARHAKQHGIALVYDNDDDMRAVPANNVAHRDYGGFAGDRALRQIRRLLQASDLAIAASTPIAERFREYGAAHVEVIENYVNDAAMDTTAPPNGEHVVAGWLAGQEHHVDPFNHARSTIKVKEYAALGKPWLASPVGPYASLGEKQGGRLVPDNGWCEGGCRAPAAGRRAACAPERGSLDPAAEEVTHQ